MMIRARWLLLLSAPGALWPALPAAAQADAHGWAGGDMRVATQGPAEPSRRIDVETFRAADGLTRLGKGRIVVVAPLPAPPPADGDDAPPATVPDDRLPVYEAAVIDQLAGKGYDIADAANPAQSVEITVSRDIVVPEEAPHRPVSGAMSLGVSNRGVGYGGALFIDLSKPRKAIIATRLDVRIRDTATRRVLWEGHAQGQSRLTEHGADDRQLATRLSAALFARFPAGTVVAPAGAGA